MGVRRAGDLDGSGRPGGGGAALKPAIVDVDHTDMARGQNRVRRQKRKICAFTGRSSKG
jgi:hypothetical protein